MWRTAAKSSAGVGSVSPGKLHPFDKPFAWAMVKLDGADVPMVHAVDAGSEDAMSTGMRVKARWADENQGPGN